MPVLNCPSCRQEMAFVPQLSGKMVACSNCGAKFVMPSAPAAAAAEPDAPPVAGASSPSAPPSALPGAVVTAPAASSPAGSSVDRLLDRSPGGSAVAKRRRPSTTPTSIFDFFDFQFKKYLTPWIVRATWALALVLALFWLLAFAAVTTIAGHNDELGQARRFVQQTQSDGSSEAAEPARPAISREFIFKSVIIISQIIGVVIFVFWLRVVLETVIVVFNIANTLTSIEDKLS